MPDLTPEQRARQQIDAQLVACGWVVQDYKQFNPSAGRGIALREAPLKSGTCDYFLLVDRKAVGVTEANGHGRGQDLPQCEPPLAASHPASNVAVWWHDESVSHLLCL